MRLALCKEVIKDLPFAALCEFAADVAGAAFRTMSDCAATLRMNADPDFELAQNLKKDLIAYVRVNDANLRDPRERHHRFTSVLATSKRRDYTGWTAVEPFVYVPDAQACAARSIGYLQDIIEGLK